MTTIKHYEIKREAVFWGFCERAAVEIQHTRISGHDSSSFLYPPGRACLAVAEEAVKLIPNITALSDLDPDKFLVSVRRLRKADPSFVHGGPRQMRIIVALTKLEKDSGWMFFPKSGKDRVEWEEVVLEAGDVMILDEGWVGKVNVEGISGGMYLNIVFR